VLRLIKVDGAYRKPPPRAPRTDPDELRIAEGVLTIDTAGEALLVLHTSPGEANRVAVALDRLAWPEVVGTIAGDDTIFLAVKNSRAQRTVLREVRRLGSPP
jgi:transcriptional regulator of arginine metabolism